MFIIRPPHTYRYNELDVREDAIISYWLGYLQQIGVTNYRVFDFHLDRTLSLESIVAAHSREPVILTCRETGDNIFYGIRILRYLLRNSAATVHLYGQTGRLAMHPEIQSLVSACPGRVRIVPHDEVLLAEALGLARDGARFGHGLRLEPYFWSQDLAARMSPERRSRFKASIETTRGCHFPCRFCFINSGDNYPQRWTRRSPEEIVSDIEGYYSRGVRNIVFNDSEFFGANSREFPAIKSMLEALVQRFPGLHFKIYARADT